MIELVIGARRKDLGGFEVGRVLPFAHRRIVSSSKGRIEQAKADWRAGGMALPFHDNAEFIPLPQGLPPEPNPMS